MKQILVIDDDLPIGDMLEEALTREGYSVSRAYSGTEALLLLTSFRPDLVLLDLMLPGLSGEELLPHIKDLPVIIISAKIDLTDKVALLLKGASDYVTKPFHIQELLARITVQLRDRVEKRNEAVLCFEELQLDTAAHVVLAGEETVKLTRTEYAILKLLIQNPSQVFAKSALLDRISRDTPDCTESSLKMHISNLRKKLREISGKDYIESVWGIGFKMKVD